jgi:SAM-dependent methyltransferase
LSAETSHWIPLKRIRIAVGIALGFAVVGLMAGFWSRPALLLLVPALGAGWTALLMLQIRRQLSPGGGGWERRIHARVVSRLALSSDSRASVLDIGCGAANLLVALLERSPAISATGIDFFGARWQYAQAACESRLARLGLHATFRRMDAAQLDFADDSFDLVVSVMCFHEVRTPAGATLRGPLRALREALRVLRPGGTFVLIDRFADAGDFGDGAELSAVLGSATSVQRESLVETLGIPWPLSSGRALGPAELLTGRKRAAST